MSEKRYTDEELTAAMMHERSKWEPQIAALTSRAEAAEAQVAALREALQEVIRLGDVEGHIGFMQETADTALSSLPASPATEKLRAREPTEEMLIAARDWSQAKYGKPIGNDAAIGCWQAMYEARAASALKGEG